MQRFFKYKPNFNNFACSTLLSKIIVPQNIVSNLFAGSTSRHCFENKLVKIKKDYQWHRSKSYKP